MLIYLWLILTTPQDRLVCELWTREITQPALVRACGTDELEKYRLDVVQNGSVVCSVPASTLYSVSSACALSSPLDGYRLRIIEPAVQTGLCSVETSGNKEPEWTVIIEQCPEAAKRTRNDVDIRFWGTRQPKPKVDTVCKPPAITQPTSISTQETYHLLAGKLIWYGLAHANCPGGYSGVDPLTFAATPCGLDGARQQMINWQNGMDTEIIAAAHEWNVPAARLKQLIATETQFWSWTGSDGEHGMIQITDAGAMVVMHVYQPGYYQMTETQKQYARSAWLRELDCLYCTPVQAYEHAKRMMSRYAQALAAYYCMYGSWDAAFAAWNIKHKAHDL